MDEARIPWMSARDAAAAIRAGELTSRDYLESMLARIDRLDGPLNLVVTRDDERARRAADEADREAARGRWRGPLHGVAMTIKDSFQTAGLRTTSGAPELAEFVPEEDAVAVARLRGAGAVIAGKTNLPLYAADVQSYNAVFGQSNNPWDTSRTVGGSSGGAAGALAAGFTPLELGSDIGGSIRGPASCCGVTGHKPSFGIVPGRGQIPGPPGTLTEADIAVVGPLARDVADLELALDILAGPNDWSAKAWSLDLPPPRHRDLADYRVAVWFDEPSAPLDASVRTLLGAAADALADAGARVDYEARPAFTFDKAVMVFNQLLNAALSGGFSRDEIEAMAAKAAEAGEGRALAARYTSQRHRDWLSANERRLQLRARWHEFFRDYDAVLAPVLPTTAIPHDHSEPMSRRTITVNGERRNYQEQFSWMGLAGASFLPATVIPVGVAEDGLPVGLQIIGPFLEDRTCLDLADRLYRLLGGFTPPPGYGPA